MSTRRILVRLGFCGIAAVGLSGIFASAAALADSATWCVAKSGVSDTDLEVALDYACGAGANCAPIQAGAACYLPNTLAAHASYAMNSFFQNGGQNPSFCNFNGAAQLTNVDPSTAGCPYPY
jgi:hypothetical protein